MWLFIYCLLWEKHAANVFQKPVLSSSVSVVLAIAVGNYCTTAFLPFYVLWDFFGSGTGACCEWKSPLWYLKIWITCFSEEIGHQMSKQKLSKKLKWIWIKKLEGGTSGCKIYRVQLLEFIFWWEGPGLSFCLGL